MITKNGYRPTGEEKPTGIVITWGADLIREKGGLLNFIRYFEKNMTRETDLWLQKCKHEPKQDIAHVYIIVNNYLRYRCLYGGYETGQTSINIGDGISWSSREIISWPRLILAGPFIKNPQKTKMSGFRAFRYCTDLF